MQAGTIAAPKRLEDLNLRRDLVASLVLRTLAFADQLSGAALEARLGLPFETIEPIIQEFQKAQLMDTMGFASEPGLDGRPIPVRMAYTVSSAGRQRAAEMSAVQTRYFGPCPVRFEDYVDLVKSQVSSRASITDAALKQALGNLQLEQHVIDQIGGAMVSRASLFIFGAPGKRVAAMRTACALDDSRAAQPQENLFHVVDGQAFAGGDIATSYGPFTHPFGEVERADDAVLGERGYPHPRRILRKARSGKRNYALARHFPSIIPRPRRHAYLRARRSPSFS